MKHRNILGLLGNILIIVSLLSTGFIYAPLIRLLVIPPQPIKITDSSMPVLTIPKINASAPIIENVNPWDKEEYMQALTKGVAHARNTALPGENGTSFLFAHSSDLPWRLTRYNTIFLKLGNLEKGDEIVITKEGIQLRYEVIEKKTVWPNEVNDLLNAQNSLNTLNSPTTQTLILQTCTPIGTDLRRLLIFATRIP
ncbi:MAG TPA: sortase [Patescibacteria group bacterium]|nr:MAG: hypothetical protein A2752_00185 [Candidatus Uhrbacteria bacterium RIFCSPHIGHO2_01_FULL_46_23]HLB60291.1 sortase [Patescibacteria group bacterium]